jgi:hypothetical protein
MKSIFYCLVLASIIVLPSCQSPLPENDLFQLKYTEGKSVNYQQLIQYYQQLDDAYVNAKLIEAGTTDVGKPLNLFILSNDKAFTPERANGINKPVMLINNGIHPGEPCGIDASLQFAHDVLRNKQELGALLNEVTLVIVPVYSVGGMLKRSEYIRTNQLTPDACGRRGNAQNLDLNRDFAKQDSRNARSLARVFQQWQPDVFLDTHTTNGSDHQHTITLIPVQPSSMNAAMEPFLRDTLLPELYAGMRETPYEMIPYVMFDNEDPREGIISYMQTPRVSTGYANLFNVYGFMTENHVYKPFADRVASVYHFIRVLSEKTAAHAEAIERTRKQAVDLTRKQKNYAFSYTLDTNQWRPLTFHGYENGQLTSELTGMQYYGYNRSKPYTAEVPFYNVYKPNLVVEAPAYYVVPQAWEQVVERLQMNGVKMQRLLKDTLITTDLTYITEHKHYPSSYNGRYFHYELETELRNEPIRLYAGDYLIAMNQKNNRYVVQMLEPKAPDSFFRWGFFDACLEARDWNNARPSFEPNAIKYLNAHPELKEAFETKRKTDKKFANDHKAQLQYIFERSPWSHRIVGRYPVVRLAKPLPANN